MTAETTTGTVAAGQPATPWRVQAIALLLSLAVPAALFSSTLGSMVATWWRSETFAHGFLVFPISGYLVWRQRQALASLPGKADLLALPVLLLFGLAWTAGHIADVRVAKQLAFVAMIPTLVWLALGRQAVSLLRFPLGFLIFAVPFGEALVFPLMQFTAGFTVNLLTLSGVPVYQEGTFFSIPSGDWSVVEGCSGVRYLIASLFLGVLYAHLMYRTAWRWLLLVALAAAFPIVANGLRAYLVVMIAHLSDMQLALGIDHLIYGWVFFGIVMFALFWLGTLWREPGVDRAPRPTHRTPAQPQAEGFRPLMALGLGLMALAVWPAWAAYLDHRRSGPGDTELDAPPPVAPWRDTQSFSPWRPRYVEPSAELKKAYTDGESKVGAYIAYYGAQEQEGELINSQNVLVVQKDPVWRMPAESAVEVEQNGEAWTVTQSKLLSEGQDLLVWHWYWLDGARLANPYAAKVREGIARLSGRYDGGAGVILYTPMGTGPGKAQTVLERYLQDMLPSIEASLRDAGRRVGDDTARPEAERQTASVKTTKRR